MSAKYAPIAAAAGCVVIDNTSQFRYQDDIPLVVPEVNPGDIARYKTHGIIANPNCSTIQMLVALKPLHDAAGISRINVATYQSVSGAGKEAVDELAAQSGELLNGRPVEAKVMAKQIAFNVLPQIDKFEDNGYTREEMKMFWETRKIMGDNSILVNATAVRVPVFLRAFRSRAHRNASEADGGRGACVAREGARRHRHGRAGCGRLANSSHRSSEPRHGVCWPHPRRYLT